MRHRFLPLALVGGLSCAYLLAYPLAIGRADESHLLFEARRVFDGQTPYRDFFESLTPLSLYLVAAVYWFAGPSLLAARVAIALCEAVGAALLFQLARRVAAWPEALLAVLLFVGVAIPTWPYASPHWITTTLGLATASVVLGETWTGAARRRPLLAGLLAGAAVCVQQQRGAFVALWLPFAWLVLGAALPRRRRRWRVAEALGWSALGGALVVLGILGHAAWRASPAALIEMVFGFAVTQYGPMHSGRQPWAAVLPLTQQYLAATWLWLLQAAPLIALAEGLSLLRGRCPRPRLDLERAALCGLAALMALSVWYLPDFIHVSFILPFLLIPGATLLYRLRCAAAWARLPGGRAVATAAVALLLAGATWKGGANLAAAQAAAPARFATAFGPVAGNTNSERLYDAIQRHDIREADGRRVVYSYPNDAWLYLVLPAENPTPFSALVPVMFPQRDIDLMLDALRARRPGVVVLAVPFTNGPVGAAIFAALDAGYDAVEEVDVYRVYARRPAAP